MKRPSFLVRALLAAVLTLVPLAGRTGPSATPAALWSFDEGAGAAARDSAGMNEAALQGNAGWAAGLVGAHALALSGNGFADVPRPVVDTSRSYTVAAWVKPSEFRGYQTFVSIDGEQVSGFFLQLRDDTGRFAFTSLTRDSPVAGTFASAVRSPRAGAWYHLAGVHDASARTLTLYVNGARQESVPFSTPWRAGGHTIIGRGKFSGRPVDFVIGAVDDVRLYPAALPASEIQSLAQAVTLPPETSDTAPAPPSVLRIDTGRAAARVSPLLYGLMTEEINYSYDGGLYAELIRNRSFKDSASTPVHWSLVQDRGASGSIALDESRPVPETALTTSLRLTVEKVGENGRAGAANDGYWGIPIRPRTRYRASFYARAGEGFEGPLTLSLESSDGKTLFARARVSRIGPEWRKYEATLGTGSVKPTKDARLVLSAVRPGTVWLNLVSLFPPTYKDRPNGLRPDLMEKLAALKPAFLRFPGGNYLEGNTIETRFDWKKTIGPLEQRPGHLGPWGYRSTDGLGLLEFLLWCEDLKMEPVLAVFAGYSLRQQHVDPGPQLAPFVQDALDEIEYVTGDASTHWGAERARGGHPAPFKLRYVEIGNEDYFDRSRSYDGRFAQFYDALKARYPDLKLIATAPVTQRAPDVLDDHFYRSAAAMQRDVHHYDNRGRTGPLIFVGEWATQEGVPTPNLNAALGDAAWMAGMERNSDVVVLSCYAPLFVNVNPGGRQWRTNLIGYDALSSYGSPSYYVQQMFHGNRGDAVLGASLTGGQDLYQSVTRDSKKGTLFVKLVNASDRAQPVRIVFEGSGPAPFGGAALTLGGASPGDTNALQEPAKVVPVTTRLTGVGRDFSYSAAPFSVTVLRLQAKPG